MSATTDEFLKACGDGLQVLAKDCLAQAEAQGVQSGLAFAKDSMVQLQLWTGQVAKGELSKDDMADLLRTHSDRFAVEALTQKGITLIEIETFKNKSIDVIVSTAFSLLKV